MSFREKIHAITTSKQGSILSASLVLAITFGLSAILGFLRSRFLYARFFNCCILELDAYNAAFRLPDLIFKLLVTGALSASFIPVFSQYLHRSPKRADRMASSVINLLLIAFSIISLLIFIFARPLTNLIVQGFTPSQIDLTINLTRILLLAQIFFLVSNFLTGILQVHQIFIVSSLSPIVYNLAIIISIFTLAPAFGIYGVTIGAVIGAFFHLLIQVPVIRKIGFHYRFTFKIGRGVREIVRLMLPRSLSLGLGEIENTVTLFFASSLSAGSISLLNLAMQLMYLPSRVFGTTVGQASLPILSRSVAKNEMNTFRRTVSNTILQSLYIALPITMLVLIHRLAIIRIAFGSKNFPWEATKLTAKVLGFLTPAIASQSVIQILVRSFYAMHDTRTPLKISFVSLIVNIATSYYFTFMTKLGIVGLAISASIGNLVQCFGLLLIFVLTVHQISWRQALSKTARLFLASGLMGLVVWGSLQISDLLVFDTSKTLGLIVLFISSSFVGLLSYLLFSYLLDLNCYQSYFRHFNRLLSYFSRK